MTKNKLKETAANSDIDKIYDSVGEISAKMKEVIWSLNTENDSLSSLIAYLQKQARQLMEHYPGRFAVSLPEIIPDTKISGEVRRQVYLSVKEALHNVIKHSGAANVEMKIECKENLLIQIADNGKGLKEDEIISFGNGLKNMRKRMEQVNGKFIVKNNNGLIVIFEIPFNSAL
jgi:signal transduction histidine kinase